jgi:hypothetical protein
MYRGEQLNNNKNNLASFVTLNGVLSKFDCISYVCGRHIVVSVITKDFLEMTFSNTDT